MKWVILDGDVDPEWIETMNTVMDDNKVLTLVSQERIPLTPAMKLVIEVSNLSQASPATVSRGGVLFINESDVGWLPFFVSWLVKYKKNDLIDSSMQLAQTTYMSEGFMEDLKSSNWDYITPVCDMQKVQSLTTIIDFLIKQLTDNKEQAAHMKNLLEENDKEKLQAIYDGIFVFAGMWAIGAGMNESKSRFSGGWKSGSQKIKFPDTNNLCFDSTSIRFSETGSFGTKRSRLSTLNTRAYSPTWLCPLLRRPVKHS
jgi:dynein heavy chain